MKSNSIVPFETIVLDTPAEPTVPNARHAVKIPIANKKHGRFGCTKCSRVFPAGSTGGSRLCDDCNLCAEELIPADVPQISIQRRRGFFRRLFG